MWKGAILQPSTDGIAIAVVEPLPGRVNERRIQSELETIGGAIDGMGHWIMAVVET